MKLIAYLDMKLKTSRSISGFGEISNELNKTENVSVTFFLTILKLKVHIRLEKFFFFFFKPLKYNDDLNISKSLFFFF